MRNMKKILSFLLAFSMVLQFVPMPALAAEDGSHHTHDGTCGYVEAVEGKPCTHQCTESCTMKDVTQCVHDHLAAGCTYTAAVEAVACDHIHDDTCNYVPAREEVKCTCEPQTVHSAECASVVTEGEACNCTTTLTHAEGCNPQDAVAESCGHQHGECAYKPAVKESWSCGHVCTKETGCVKAVCAHAHDTECGFVQEVKGSECTHVCEECEAQPQVDEAVEAVRAQIEALPTAEAAGAMSNEELGGWNNAIQAAYDATMLWPTSRRPNSPPRARS